MFKRLVLLLVTAGFALAQDDADIPAKFRNRITEEQYQQLRDEYVNLLRGLPADPSLRAKAIEQLQSQLKTSAKAAAIPWTSLGPSPIPNGQVAGALPVTGRVTAFEIDPTNSAKVYLGTAQGGVYRSLNGGTTWVQIFDGANTSAIGALALAPSNPTILYVGTGESNSSIDSYAGVGLYRIDNADTSATLVGPINPVRNYNDGSGNPVSAPVFNGRSISSILVHPTDPTTIYVGTTSGIMGIGFDPPFGGTIPPLGMRGLYRLTNATSAPASVVAQKLTVTLSPTPAFDTPNTGNRNVTGMVFEPGNPNNMIVWILGNAAAGDGGIYRSTNAQAANPAFTQVLTTATSSARGQFAIYKQVSAPNVVVYAATGEGNGRVRVSTDGGATWPTITAGGGGFCDGQCFYNIGLDVLPGPTAATTDDIIVLGGNVGGTSTPGTRLFGKSTDGGATFPDSSAGLHADTHFIRIDPTNSLVIYHGNDGGIFKTVNGGTTWASLNTMPINTVQFSGLAVHPTDAKWSIGGTQDNGTNMRMSDGSWMRVDFGDGGYALVDRNATDTTNMTLYHTYFNQTNNLLGFGRVLSTACASDGNWAFKGIYGGVVDPTPNCDSSDTFNGISLSDPVLFYAPMELGPGNPNTVYYGAGKVYRSADKGETMPAVSQSAGSPVSSISVSPQDDNYRLFGRQDGTIFYTTTGANPMTALTGIPAKFIGRVKFDPSNKNTAYVALGGYFGGTSTAQSHVWKVTNLSTSPVVTGINSGLPDVPVNSFAVDPGNSNNLFAGTDIGVYGSTDGGATWAPYGTGLPVVAVFGAEIQPTSRKLRIATHGRGMWDINLPALGGGVPDLTITKTHVGNFTQGQIGATYTITVTNSGTGPTTLGVSVSDVVPAGLTATAISGTGWTCTQPSGPCTRNDALAASASYPPITLTVDVSPSAPASVNNTAQVGGGGETDTSNDVAVDPTTIVAGAGVPDLTITKAHTGNFTQGQTGATYTITVTNSGTAATSGTVTVTDTVPAGLTATAISGTGWTCTQPSGPCTRSDALAATASYPALTLTVNVSASAPASVTNTATVAGGGETNTANDTANDVTTINTSGVGPPTVVSVSPINGSGSTQTFTVVYSDPAGNADLSAMHLLFNSTLNGAGACWSFYDRGTNMIYLVNDAGTGFAAGSVIPGGAGTASNSQCTISSGGAISTTANTLTLPVAITFAPSFAGTKSVYGYATGFDGQVSGWQLKGTWNTTGAAAPPTVVSVTPINGTGSFQTFSVVYSDPAGSADLSGMHLLFNTTLNAVNACWAFYDRGTNMIYLINDAGNSFAPGSVTPGGGGSASNSQCTISSGGPISTTANTLTLPVAIHFNPVMFSGTKNVYGLAVGFDGLNSGWQLKGTWKPF